MLTYWFQDEVLNSWYVQQHSELSCLAYLFHIVYHYSPSCSLCSNHTGSIDFCSSSNRPSSLQAQSLQKSYAVSLRGTCQLISQLLFALLTHIHPFTLVATDSASSLWASYTRSGPSNILSVLPILLQCRLISVLNSYYGWFNVCFKIAWKLKEGRDSVCLVYFCIHKLPFTICVIPWHRVA